MAPPLPKTIGRYEILSLIGRGGMGVLYRARDPVLEREVALKMMLLDFSFDQTARERFEREAKAVARLQHHNVVTIHELGQNDGAPYIVMELLGGQDLEALLRQGQPVPLPTKLEIVAQLCEGLSYAHEQGIVHRDIKPGNVRVLEDGTVKILDFGIAKFAQSSMTQSGAIMGTAHYMAPEQILGNPIDGRADLFAVGVLLHELLSGRKPFAADSPTAVVYQIVHTEAPLMSEAAPGLPDALNEIVARALKKNPNDRYSRASDMASDLRLVKMMLDLSPAQSGAGGSFDVTIAPGLPKLHATGALKPLAPPPASVATGSTTASTAGSAPGMAVTQAPLVGAVREPTRLPPDMALTQPPRVAAVNEPPVPVADMALTQAPRSAPAPIEAAQQVKTRANVGLIGAIAAGAVLVIGLATFFAMRGRTEPTAPPAAAPAPASVAAVPAPQVTATPAAKPAVQVTVSSVPAGARILLNGVDTGKATPAPVRLDGKTLGTLEVSLKGYQAMSATLTDADVKRGSKEFQLVRELIPVRLSVTGSFPFELTQGGSVLSPMATHHEVTISPGSGVVTAHNADYLLDEPVHVDFQKPQIDVTLKGSGILAVYSSVETCAIVVDGHDVGFPPLPRKPIAAGTHTVTLKCRDGKEDSRQVVVGSGERAAVTFGTPRP